FVSPIQPYVLTPACFKHSRKGIEKNEIWRDSNVVLWAGQCPKRSKTEVAASRRDVCYAPVSGHRQTDSACPKLSCQCDRVTAPNPRIFHEFRRHKDFNTYPRRPTIKFGFLEWLEVAFFEPP